jgi:hypothetical protein
MKCGPENCPLTAWSALSARERKVQRKPLAEQLYKQGFTMEDIAAQFGVTHKTISQDLREFVPEVQTKERQSKRGRKGEGRPKGSGRKLSRGKSTPKLDRARAIVREKIEANEPVGPHTLEKEHGGDISHVTFDMAITAELARKEALSDQIPIDPATFPKTTKEKVELWQRRELRRMEAEYEQKLRDKLKEHYDRLLPEYEEKLREAEQTIKRRQGIMSAATFKKILTCLHPDRIQDEGLKRRFADAFNSFKRLELLLVAEDEKPTAEMPWPKTYAEMMAMKEKVKQARRARRGNMPAPRH